MGWFGNLICRDHILKFVCLIPHMKFAQQECFTLVIFWYTDTGHRKRVFSSFKQTSNTLTPKMSECIILSLPLPPWSHAFLAIAIAVPPSIKQISRCLPLLMPTYIAWCRVNSSHLLLLFCLVPSQYELVQTLFNPCNFRALWSASNVHLPLGWAKYFCQDDKISSLSHPDHLTISHNNKSLRETFSSRSPPNVHCDH